MKIFSSILFVFGVWFSTYAIENSIKDNFDGDHINTDKWNVKCEDGVKCVCEKNVLKFWMDTYFSGYKKGIVVSRDSVATEKGDVTLKFRLIIPHSGKEAFKHYGFIRITPNPTGDETNSLEYSFFCDDNDGLGSRWHWLSIYNSLPEGGNLPRQKQMRLGGANGLNWRIEGNKWYSIKLSLNKTSKNACLEILNEDGAAVGKASLIYDDKFNISPLYYVSIGYLVWGVNTKTGSGFYVDNISMEESK